MALRPGESLARLWSSRDAARRQHTKRTLRLHYCPPWAVLQRHMGQDNARAAANQRLKPLFTHNSPPARPRTASTRQHCGVAPLFLSCLFR